MGAFKPLLPFGPDTVIERIIATVREAGVETLRVVVGWQADLLIPVLDRHGVPWIRNERFEEGMYASIQAGVGSLPAGVSAFFLLPGDMPLVRAATLSRLTAEWDQRPGGILYPCHEGRRGHPPLIASPYIPEILREVASRWAPHSPRPPRADRPRDRMRGPRNPSGPGHTGRVPAEP